MFTVIVRRVVEARRNHGKGIKGDLPTAHARTAPLEPSRSYNEKGRQVGQRDVFDDIDREEQQKKRWLSSLKCW